MTQGLEKRGEIKGVVARLQNFIHCIGKELSFFFKHYGKNRFMVAMSKKIQVLGVERLWRVGRKAFIYFFIFYLVRDTILYIIIPIYIARLTSG
ncbi:MAG: hypothetical protein OXB84_04710 [Halobacteriovoraceae bacterium]|nr:hypothetical protein [Halobacteriovoraceae bacterium]